MASRKTTLSPIQRFRKNSNDEESRVQITYTIDTGYIPTLESTRDLIYPIIKQWTWIKKAKDALSYADPKASLTLKHLSSINMGILFGYHTEGKIVEYITSIHLTAWAIHEKDLRTQANDNLLTKISKIEKENKVLFTELQTGIFYCNKLKDLTASLLTIPEIFQKIPLKVTNYVVACPRSNLIVVSHCHDARGLCLIGEFLLRCIQDNGKGLICSRPIKVNKTSLAFYEASMVRNESPIPNTDLQVKNYKKAVVKRSLKRASVHN